MPNFTARITAGASRAEWTDERLRPSPAHPHSYRQVPQGTTVTVKATVDGVEGEVDANLGGELFTAAFAEVPTWPAPAITSPAGQSSVATFTIAANASVGHYTLVLRRANGGSILIPFYVYDPS